MIENTSSSIGYVTSGVPQGSVLGPLLFVLFINDLPNALSNYDCHLFADDSKLYSSATHFDIQRDVDLINQLTVGNEMTFNADKCKVICPNSNELETSLGINDISIPSVSSSEDLGVTISQNLKWDNHLNHKFITVKKSLTLSNVLFHTTTPCGPSLRSGLIYGRQIWFFP